MSNYDKLIEQERKLEKFKRKPFDAAKFAERKMREEMEGIKYRKGWLNPIKPEERDFKFLVADIESMNWVDFLCIGLYDGDCFEYYEEFDGFYDAIRLWAQMFSEPKEKEVKMSEFIDGDWVTENKTAFVRSVPIFVHNGGRYDFNFFMKYLYKGNPDIYLADGIPIGSSILLLKVHYRISKTEVVEICFWDSTKLLPFSLAELTKYFNVEHKKLEIDHTETKGITPELIHYLEHDCKGHYEVMKSFYSWGRVSTAPKGYTMASQSFNVFKTFLKNSIPPLNEQDDIKFRKGYYGGRTEIFKPVFDEKKSFIKAYDVNSLYPSMMRDSLVCYKIDKPASRFTDKQWGIWEMDIEVPEMYIPPLPSIVEVNKTNKLIFPTGVIHGTWETNEIVYALSLGCKIKKVYKGTLFHKGEYLFKEYVDFFYELRLQAKREKNLVNDIMCKLLLNSLYGRFALRKDRELLEEFTGQDFTNLIGEINLGKVDIDGKTLDNFARIVSVPSNYEGFSNVALSLQITANARVCVHKKMMKAPHELYYTDTDSLYTTHEYENDPNTLGALKYEGRANQACFILPKSYCWMENDEKTGEVKKKIRLKGFNTKTLKEEDESDIQLIQDSLLADKIAGKKLSKQDIDRLNLYQSKGYTKNINEFTFENFCDYLEGSQRLINIQQSKFATFRSAVRKGEFVTMMDAHIKEIRSKYDKRFVYKTENGEYDTRPLHIVDGVAK